MPNMYDSAYELEKSIRNSMEFKELKESYEKVIGNPETNKLFTEFRDTQMGLQEKQMKGEDIDEAEIEEARKVVEQVQQNELISNLIEKEQRLSLLINDINRIVTKPLEELYTFENGQ